MTHHTFVEKKLHLRFKGSDRKTKNLIISRPKDKLKKDSANIAAESGCLSLTTINNRINIHRLSRWIFICGVSFFYIDCTE